MSDLCKSQATPFVPVILAGGSGTRFWPRSRRNRAKQVLALDGEQTMIQQTVDRLLPLARAEDIWVITNELLDEVIGEQLPMVAREHILREPAARNTAPACALAAFLLERRSPEAVIGIFPSDHVVTNTPRFGQVIEAAIALAASGPKIVVLGVSPTRAETGYGYIEQGSFVDPDPSWMGCAGLRARRVKRFTEKPDPARAAEFVTSGNYAWNSGIFIWSARTLAAAIREHCPAIAPHLEKIAAAHGTPEFEAVFAQVYPLCQNISIDYAVLEPRSAKGELASEIYCLPADFGWNDLGSWASLHEHQAARPEFSGRTDANVIHSAQEVVIEARANYVYAPGKMVVLVGVDDLVVVETDDALLITTRSRSQEIGKVVKKLSDAGQDELI
jgi:mannose-1-phosphate guanylyltransferase